jgi:hypothetical protein
MAHKICLVLLMAAACDTQVSDTPDAGLKVSPGKGDQASEDAAVPGCATEATQLLANPSFDQFPEGTGWTQALIASNSPLITDADGVVEHTAPFKAWLGGIEAPIGGTVKDWLVQDVTIPANTTTLVLTGMHDVRTSEAATTTEYDTAKLLITELDGTTIAVVLALSNATPKSGWTTFGHTFTQDLSGKKVRLRITSTNDELDPTSFYFDSLALTAMRCKS